MVSADWAPPMRSIPGMAEHSKHSQTSFQTFYGCASPIAHHDFDAVGGDGASVGQNGQGSGGLRLDARPLGTHVFKGLKVSITTQISIKHF